VENLENSGTVIRIRGFVGRDNVFLLQYATDT
jgi:hypothetical protein